MESIGALFPFALILAAFYLLIIRPARKRSQSAVALQQQLAPGLEIMTTAGIFGRVVSVDEDAVTVEVSPGTSMRFAKAAVGRILTEESPDEVDGDRPDPDESSR